MVVKLRLFEVRTGFGLACDLQSSCSFIEMQVQSTQFFIYWQVAKSEIFLFLLQVDLDDVVKLNNLNCDTSCHVHNESSHARTHDTNSYDVANRENLINVVLHFFNIVLV